MKLSVIITTILVVQVSASFFDVFHGAVLSVQNSFGKLLSDVVTDVKETVDCTILAVEHVLSLSNDATTRYYEKCGSVTNQNGSVSETRQDAASAPKLELTFNLPNNSEYLQKMIPAELDTRINETLSKKYHDNVLSIENVLVKESEQLPGVSVLVKTELDKLSHEVPTDLKKIEKQRDSEPSVDINLQEIVLEKREQNTKNNSEASEIHQVIDQVLGKLDAIEATQANENINHEEILKDLESNSNNSFVGLRQQFEDWKEEESRHLSGIKSKIEEHEKILDHPGSFNRHGFESPTTVGSSEVVTLPTNQSTTQNNLTINNTNESVTNTTLGIINSAPLNKTIPPIDLLADLNKQESSSVTANEPTTVLSTNANNSNETVNMSNPLQPPEITETKGAILPIKRNTDSGKKESSESAIHNEAVIISAAETAGIEMTSTSQSNNNSNDIVISITANTMVENTSVNATSSENVESSTSATSEVVATLATIHVIASNDTILTSTLSNINFSSPLNVTIVPNESSTANVNEKSSTVTAKIINNNNSNNTMLPSASSANLESIPISETIQSKETILASGKYQSITELYDPIITSTSLPTVKNTPVSVSVKLEETGTTSDNEKPSTVTTKTVNDNDSNNTIITTVSLPIVGNTSVSGTVEPKETITVSGNEEFSNDLNVTMIKSTSLPIIESTLINKTIQPDETTTSSSNKEFSTETTSEFTTTSKIVNVNDSDTTITSTPNPIISTSESAVSTNDEESLGSNANSPTGTPNTEGDDDDDSSAAVVTMTPEAILESIPHKNVIAAENDETLASTTNSLIASPATLIDTDSNTDVITSTAFPSAEITTVSEVIEPVKSTAPTENVELSVLSTTLENIPDEVTDKNTDTIETVTTTIKNADSAVVTEIIQTNEISTASEEQELSSTSITTQSVINVTSTVFPPIESISTSRSITASRNEDDLKNSPTLEANTSRTPEILNSPDLHVRSPPLTITESVPVNREWLTSNTLKQQNYNTNKAPRNNYEFNAPVSFSDPLLETGQPLINTEIPMYGQAMPPITRSLFNGAPKLLTPDRLIPNVPNRQPKIENVQLPQAAFEFFDSADKQLSHSDSPFGPEEDIPKIANTPSPPSITNALRKPIDSQRLNYENPSYVPTPKYPIGQPYSFDNRAPANTYRPQDLTTERPKKTAARANNYKSPTMDYDSIFHTPPRNSEAHQRALKEARQLMANSKRAERIINNIMKNRNKFNARNVFG